jgi:hypothetical protein
MKKRAKASSHQHSKIPVFQFLYPTMAPQYQYVHQKHHNNFIFVLAPSMPNCSHGAQRTLLQLLKEGGAGKR